MGDRIRTRTATVLAMILLPGAAAWAQTAPARQDAAPAQKGEGGVIAGHGEVTLHPLPTALKLHLNLSAKGKNVEEAVAQLKERQQAASARLEKFGADKKSIRPGSMSLTQGDSADRRQLQQMIRQRVRSAGPAKETPKGPATVAIGATLIAEFPLTVKDADAAFLAAHRLKEKVKAAKLAVFGEDEKLSAEEEEMREEMDLSDPYGEQNRDPNVPVILYLTRISKEAQTKALAESFAKAKENAAASARAAGVELGAVETIHNNLQATRDTSGFAGGAYSMGRYSPPMDMDEEEAGLQNAQTESVAPEPGQVAFQATTMVLFRTGERGKAASARISPWEMGMGGLGRLDPGESIAGNGTAMVKRPPTLLRMYLLVKGKGKKAEEALANLQERRAAAIAELEKLGADSKTIEPGTPSVSREDAERRQNMERMIRDRMRSGGKAARKVKLPESVTLTSMLTAQWPLPAKPPEELFVMVQKLQAQVKDARLATGKGGEELSEEEKELAEEIGAELDQMTSYGNDQGDPNTPYFVYVARIAPEERDRARAEAFEKAKADAQRLAQAVGVKLATLVSVTTGGMGGSESMDEYDSQVVNAAPRRMQEILNRQQYSRGRANRDDEAIGSSPDRIGFRFTAMAGFSQAKAAGTEQAGPPGLSARGMVSGSGTAVVQKFPTTMRMMMAIPGKGKNLDEALADLSQRRQAAVAQLEKLGARKESLKASLPVVSMMEAQQRRQMERMMAPRLRGRGSSAKPPKLPETVTVLARLTADWPVEAKNSEDLFVAVHHLREKIEAAKLAGNPQAAKPSAEDQEMQEMLAEAAEPGDPFGPGFDMMGSAGPASINTPNFIFVATITDEERQKAFGQAMEKAKAEAAAVAQSAGTRLGPLVGISSGTDAFRYGRSFPRAFLPPSGPYPGAGMPYFDADGAWKEDEGMTGEPGPVKFTFTTYASFASASAAGQPAKDK